MLCVLEDPKNNTAAKIGLMRCNFQLKNYGDAITNANKVLGIEKSSSELTSEAHYIIASSQFATGKYEDAIAEFQVVVNTAKNDMGAESKYNIALIQFYNCDYKKSQKTIFELINGEGDFPYWDSKAMILLADNYVDTKDNFQAKATLKSIITDSEIPELVKIAQQKLDKINADEEEAKKSKEIKEQPLNIQFEGTSPQQNNLFVEPSIKKDSVELKKE